MIVGAFDRYGRPYVECRVVIQRLTIDSEIGFLLDTGAESTLLHPTDAYNMGVPFDSLANEAASVGVGGLGRYFREPAVLIFEDGLQTRMYGTQLLIANPDENNRRLPSLLGRNIINHWRIEYDPSNGVLECLVRHADYTLDAA